MSLRGNGNRWIAPMAEGEGDFLEGELPARAFATLTTPYRLAPDRLSELFREWVRNVQAHERMTLGWISSVEINPQPHIHATLIAASPLNCVHAGALWRALVGPRYEQAARVKPYENGLCGLGYVLKRLGSPRVEPQFSDNIRAFVTGDGKSMFKTDSRQRRQVRRVKAVIRAQCSRTTQESRE